MLVIGLTGGIGCGKSTVTELFEKRNIPVIDADEIAHNIVQPGQHALTLIRKKFGERILNNNGSLNRDKLRDIVFQNPDAKKTLEKILHPIIFSNMHKQLQGMQSPYGILSIPLLFETNHQHEVDRVLVIDCPEIMQIERVKKRNQFDSKLIQSIMESQCSRAARLQQADDIIENNGSLQSLDEAVQKVHEFYLSFSAGKKE